MYHYDLNILPSRQSAVRMSMIVTALQFSVLLKTQREKAAERTQAEPAAALIVRKGNRTTCEQGKPRENKYGALRKYSHLYPLL